MKKVLIGVCLVMLLVIVSSCKKKELTFTCDVDTSKTGFQLAGAYDDCLVWNAQKIMAHIESEDIDIRSTNLDVLPFGSSYADLNAGENWIQPVYTIIPEDMTAYPNTPDTINGVVLAKFKSKDKIDEDFGLSNDSPQGICADVQQVVYDTVLNTILSKEERDNYLSEGKQLQFIPDDDWPPLDETTNPVNRGSSWLDVDPAAMVTRDGDNYYYEPRALYVEFDDPAFQDVDEKYRGVRYCKFLSHQAILSWMLEKSFEEDPVLITPSVPECNRPSSLDSQAGSCLFYFSHAETYYCSDYTGSGFTFENAEAKCNSRPANPYLNPTYSTSPCSEREDEIESTIPGYQGLTGICVVHCQTAEEFIWNIYTENPEESCGDFEFFTPGEIPPESYPPMPEALDALESDRAVTVREVIVEEWEENSNYYYAFEPNNADPTVGFIFYPGGLVDPRSYAPPVRAIAAEGYVTFIVKMPDDLAPLGTNRANTIIDDDHYSGIKKWIIGGHSVGGTFACAFAKNFTDQLDGIAIWASYPSEGFRIDDKELKALLIYGTNNPNVNDDEIEENRPYLPSDTTYVRIEGGNHTQFGWYDTSPSLIQTGDDFADITREAQQDIIIQSTVDFLSQFTTSN